MMPGNDIELRKPASAPALYEVNQAGEHNTNIAHVEHAHMSVMMMSMPIGQASPLGSFASIPQLDSSCFHIFVIAGEDFSTGRFFVDPTRALTEYTSNELRNRYQHLDAAAIDELKSFPALLMAENARPGTAAPDQQVLWGYLTDIRVQENSIRITFSTFMRMPQQSLNQHYHHFGIASYGRTTELNRTHWALKRINLINACTDAGLGHLSSYYRSLSCKKAPRHE